MRLLIDRSTRTNRRKLHDIRRGPDSSSSSSRIFANGFSRERGSQSLGRENRTTRRQRISSYLGQGCQALLLHVPDELIPRELKTLADVKFRDVHPGEEDSLLHRTGLRSGSCDCSRILILLTLSLALSLASLRTRGLARRLSRASS